MIALPVSPAAEAVVKELLNTQMLSQPFLSTLREKSWAELLAGQPIGVRDALRQMADRE